MITGKFYEIKEVLPYKQAIYRSFATKNPKYLKELIRRLNQRIRKLKEGDKIRFLNLKGFYVLKNFKIHGKEGFKLKIVILIRSIFQI